MTRASDLLKKLHETPYLHDLDIDPTEVGTDLLIHVGKTSDEALSRAYTKLGEIKTPKGVVQFFIDKKDEDHVRGYIYNDNYSKKVGKSYNDLIFSLTIETDLTFAVPFRNAIQVSGVGTIKKFQFEGIALYAYMLLAKRGFTVVSDSTQFQGGYGLWKKLARNAKLGNYKVSIYNIKSKDFLRDSSGDVVMYDSTNIKDSEIWTTGNNKKGLNVVLTLNKLKT